MKQLPKFHQYSHHHCTNQFGVWILLEGRKISFKPLRQYLLSFVMFKIPSVKLNYVDTETKSLSITIYLLLCTPAKCTLVIFSLKRT